MARGVAEKMTDEEREAKFISEWNLVGPRERRRFVERLLWRRKTPYAMQTKWRGLLRLLKKSERIEREDVREAHRHRLERHELKKIVRELGALRERTQSASVDHASGVGEIVDAIGQFVLAFAGATS